ncbi:hypothetical protein KFK09_024561 [Dendrobium nobile]|uniref:Uncharacterized protein n=1 Tax=Dendrobium nobile TaxID=94219 RepID=A0A8T3ADF2_DENNO|nr:hypothetical protein KFK09_024561 [Dendrobium nobile]
MIYNWKTQEGEMEEKKTSSKRKWSQIREPKQRETTTKRIHKSLTKREQKSTKTKLLQKVQLSEFAQAEEQKLPSSTNSHDSG